MSLTITIVLSWIRTTFYMRLKKVTFYDDLLLNNRECLVTPLSDFSIVQRCLDTSKNGDYDHTVAVMMEY